MFSEMLQAHEPIPVKSPDIGIDRDRDRDVDIDIDLISLDNPN